VKRSLSGYVRGMSDGTVITDRGAREEPAGFLFPGVGLVFSGSVTFTAHGGMMRVVIADPALIEDGEKWMLEIADPANATLRLPFAEVATFDGGNGTGLTLTSGGAALFSGPYEAGTPLEDFVIRE
jgi:hypothetical protein